MAKAIEKDDLMVQEESLISDDNIFIDDIWNHRIEMFDLDGNFLAAVGSKRKSP